MDIEKLIERLWNYKELEQVKRERDEAVSYTHLDVYKRQGLRLDF